MTGSIVYISYIVSTVYIYEKQQDNTDTNKTSVIPEISEFVKNGLER